MILLYPLYIIQDNFIPTGNYILADQSDTSIFLPTLEIDSKEHTFIFSYDILSSYLPKGTYKIKNNILIATTDDGRYRYSFKIVNKNTLSFIMEDSSNIKFIDNRLRIPILPNAIFYNQE